MRIISWIYRGLGGPSTIPQLEESLRLYLPDLLFLCETKQSSCFIKSKCKSLSLGKNWDVVEPVGKKGGMFVAWSDSVQIKQIYKNNFCFELLVEPKKVEDSFWAIFVYASSESNQRGGGWQ